MGSELTENEIRKMRAECIDPHSAVTVQQHALVFSSALLAARERIAELERVSAGRQRNNEALSADAAKVLRERDQLRAVFDAETNAEAEVASEALRAFEEDRDMTAYAAGQPASVEPDREALRKEVLRRGTEIAAKAWGEGWETGFLDNEHGEGTITPNPYRAAGRKP